jgi:aspartate kinase
MKVLKFGGTSVGSAQRMKEVARLILDGEQKMVVLSAMSGTTNTLVEISDYLYKRNPEAANELINQLVSKYNAVADALYDKESTKREANTFLAETFEYIRSFTKNLFTLFEEKIIVAQGEIISTNLFTFYLKEKGIAVILLPALEFMRLDKNGEPDMAYIRENLNRLLAANPVAAIYILKALSV